MSGLDLPWRPCDAGLRLALRLTPKAARDVIDGLTTLAGGRVVLQARVRAVPEKGKANLALEKLLANALGVAASDVKVESGKTARLKSVLISGDPDDLGQRLAAFARPVRAARR